MLRRIFRLLLFGLLAALAVWVISRLLNQEEDFEDYDDIDAGLDFVETPVEIDVTTTEPVAEMTPAEAPAEAIVQVVDTTPEVPAAAPSEGGASLIEINGIGPTYASKLNDIGIHSLEDLTHADPAFIAEHLDVRKGQSEVENWIEQARGMISGGASGGE